MKTNELMLLYDYYMNMAVHPDCHWSEIEVYYNQYTKIAKNIAREIERRA